MNSIEHVQMPTPLRKRDVVILIAFAIIGLCIFGVTGYFRLSAETAALSSSVIRSAPGQWNKKIALHIGALTTGVVRGSLRWVELPPEPRAAIAALHGVEVAVYKLQSSVVCTGRDALLPAADKAMAARGWERAVGVFKDQDVVGIYFPRKGIAAKRMKCCFMVLHEDTLVVGTARGNIKPLLEMARNAFDKQHRATMRDAWKPDLVLPHHSFPRTRKEFEWKAARIGG